MAEDKIDPRRAFILAYRKSVARWRKANLGEELAIRVALQAAENFVELTPEQRRDVEEFLKDETTPRENRKGAKYETPDIPFEFEVE